MKLHSLLSSIGALTGAALIAVLYFTIGLGWIMLTVVSIVILAAYITAAVSVKPALKLSEFSRGLLLGLNSCLNGFLVFSLMSTLSPVAAATIAGITIGVINFLTALHWLSQTEVYQGIIGWSNWVLPMSWPIVGLGLCFLLFSLLLAVVTGFRVNYLKLQGIKIDWPTGTIFIRGGLVSNINAWDTAFNMGNFAFVDMNSSHWEIKHEAGHTLNLAAFGWIFHLIGAIDEIVLHRGANAYSERIAESNDSGAGGNNIPMWS
ncbi:MAG: hypothetical protein ABFS24_12380 [Pseudomonadota bacterium]